MYVRSTVVLRRDVRPAAPLLCGSALGALVLSRQSLCGGESACRGSRLPALRCARCACRLAAGLRAARRGTGRAGEANVMVVVHALLLRRGCCTRCGFLPRCRCTCRVRRGATARPVRSGRLAAARPPRELPPRGGGARRGLAARGALHVRRGQRRAGARRGHSRCADATLDVYYALSAQVTLDAVYALAVGVALVLIPYSMPMSHS